MLSIQTPVAKRRRIPLTPLIDVIFILIMFFLLSSSFGVWRPLDVAIGGGEPEKAEDPQAAIGRPSVYILVRQRAGAGEAVLTVNGNDIALPDLSAELNRLADRGAESAVLVPASDTEFQRVIHILDLARTSKLKRISLQLN